jgi:hypothetical protein
VYSYRKNLVGLFIPSNLNKFVNTSDVKTLGNTVSGENMSLHYDNASRTFSLTFNVTNPFAFNLTLDYISANVTDHDDGFPLGWISINGPIYMGSQETTPIRVSAMLTPTAAEHISNAFLTAQTLGIDVSNFTIAIQGIVFHSSQIITLQLPNPLERVP